MPLVGSLGMAIDFALVSQARQQMAVAADAAALAAVKQAAADVAANPSDPNIIADGVTAGGEWFKAQLGSMSKRVRPDPPCVAISHDGASVTSTVRYSATVPALFGTIFGFHGFPVSGVAAASIQVNAFVDTSLVINTSAAVPAVRSAVAAAIAQLSAAEAGQPRYGVGVYAIGARPRMLYPAAGEAGTDLGAAQAALAGYAPRPGDLAGFGTAVGFIAQHMTVSGDGSSPSSPRKNLFILTDTARDDARHAVRADCATLKNMGIAVYVLYITKSEHSALAADLRACVSDPAHGFWQVRDAAEIADTLKRLVAGAMDQPARVRS